MSFDLITLSFFLLFLLSPCLHHPHVFLPPPSGDERRQMIVGKARVFSLHRHGGLSAPVCPARVLPGSNRPAQSPNHPFHRRHSFHLQPGLVPAEAGRVTMENRICALREFPACPRGTGESGCGVSRQTINAIEEQQIRPPPGPGVPSGTGVGDHSGRAVHPRPVAKPPIGFHKKRAPEFREPVCPLSKDSGQRGPLSGLIHQDTVSAVIAAIHHRRTRHPSPSFRKAKKGVANQVHL